MSFPFYGVAIFVLWIAVMAFGHYTLFSYESKECSRGTVKSTWPEKASFTPGRLPTIVMFIHPLCVCSKASVEEFSNLMRNRSSKVNAVIYVMMPREKQKDFASAPIVERAGRIPDVRVLLDFDNKEAKTFGVETSGHVLIYDERGILKFNGGITAARGEPGPNRYEDEALKTLNSMLSARSAPPVFGCSLNNCSR